MSGIELPTFDVLNLKQKAGESAAVLLLRCLPTAKKAHTGFICSQVTLNIHRFGLEGSFLFYLYTLNISRDCRRYLYSGAFVTL